MTKKGACPVCGADGKACGAPGPGMGFVLKEATVGPLQLYEVQVNGHTTRMKLNAADAERLGGVPVARPMAAEAEQEPQTAPAAKKRTAARNKARTAANKDG